MLFISGLDSAKEEHATFERFFLQRGLATLTLDGPGQGETWYRMKMRVDFGRGNGLDWMRARRRVMSASSRASGVESSKPEDPRASRAELGFTAVLEWSAGPVTATVNRAL